MLSLLVMLAGILTAGNGHAVPSRSEVQRPVKIGERLEVSPLIQLARMLQGSGYRARIEFVIVALEEMSSAYKTEAQAIDVAAAPDRSTRNHLARWRMATLKYADSLDQLNHSIHRNSEIQIVIDSQNLLRLNVDYRPVIIAGPRIDQPQSLARRIVERYCLGKACSTLTENGPPQTISEVDEVFATWNFAQDKAPTLHTRDGLSFSFRSAADLGERKQACLSLIKELRVLSENIGYFRDHGIWVDWNAIKVYQLTDSKLQHVVLNRAGDYVLLQVPELSRKPLVLSDAIPWLRGKAQQQRTGRAPPSTELLLSSS